MARKAAMTGKPTNLGQYASKVYWASGDEELQVRTTARMKGRTISGYIRDLVMIDIAMNTKSTTTAPIGTMPPGYNPGDEITFFEEPIKPITPEEDAAEFARLLRESEHEDTEDNKDDDMDL